MNNYVFILNSQQQPLKACTPKRARLLQEKGFAKAFRRYPFTLILQGETKACEPYLELRIDSGQKIYFINQL